MEELKAILLSGEERHTDAEISIRKLENGIEIDYHQMYGAPSLSFAMLKKLSDLFGTDKIDVDNYGRGGCETCDYGSAYGHTIQVLEPTKNVPQFPANKELHVMGKKA